MFRRVKRKKGVRRGSSEPYRHSHFGVSPCANMCCRTRRYTCGLAPSHGILCPCGRCSNHGAHSSSANEDVEPKRHFALHTRAAALKTRWHSSTWPAWSAVAEFQSHTPSHDLSQGQWAVFGLEIQPLQNYLATPKCADCPMLL
jgi:hypothetical protein